MKIPEKEIRIHELLVTEFSPPEKFPAKDQPVRTRRSIVGNHRNE
jgi:hypothetical protein